MNKIFLILLILVTSCQSAFIRRNPNSNLEILLRSRNCFSSLENSLFDHNNLQLNWNKLIESLNDSANFSPSNNFEWALKDLFEQLDESNKEYLLRRLENLKRQNQSIVLRNVKYPVLNEAIDRLKLFKKKKIVYWPSEGLKSNFEISSYTLDILHLLSEKNTGFINIYTQSKSEFLSHNINELSDFINIKFALLYSKDIKLQKSELNKKITKDASKLLLLILPFQFHRQSIPFKLTHLKIFKNKGPKGLYRYLYYTHGASRALKYWVSHLRNLSLIFILAMASYTYGDVYDNYTFWDNLWYADLEENSDIELLHQIIIDNQKSPDEFKSHMIEYLEKQKTDNSDINDSIRELSQIISTLDLE